jgi:ubiquinone/menaquinone biosynthesis C-methylase UbiE
MLKITSEGEFGENIEPLSYIEGRGLISNIILPVTRWLRAINVEKYMPIPANRHLDIGCGDGYFLRRSQCKERYGLDKLLGDHVSDTLDFPDSFFDYITMLAVIEHISDLQAIFKEITRVLRHEGKLIITTPKKSSDWLLKLYTKDIDERHESYLDLDKIRTLSKDMFEIVGYHTFIFGLNQVFCLKKTV